MIRNRLSELLSERGLKTSRVALEVGIARSSLTSMIQNDSEMVRYDAIDKLCNYLNITPCDFFDYSPLTFNFTLDDDPQIIVEEIFFELSLNLKDGIDIKKFEFDILVDMYDEEHNKKDFDLEVVFDKFRKNNKNKHDLIFKVVRENDNKTLKDYVETLSPGLKNVLFKKLQKLITSYVIEYLKKNTEDTETLNLDNNKQISLYKEIDNITCYLESSIFTEY
ncbi:MULTISPECIES: helix-turn-helix transcriptional regulator [Staphylococcus]|uniref:helix-turn-helix domain-containing protein n=1 Tax=Staphylococcus TaxID=1279 RepID=UPI00069DF89A|nr:MULTISPECIES: helix-turn-helix transcriptional regulator [Staphylococcus]MCE5000299.1 helix-turn-helix transcriptional regulator [Staphylococcus warneri]MDU0444728.1 helix-turn-helix transcriptional regulator [Staphylococcus haemolyticus]